MNSLRARVVSFLDGLVNLSEIQAIVMISTTMVAVAICIGVAFLVAFTIPMSRVVSVSPERAYAREMAPILIEVDKWGHGPLAEVWRILGAAHPDYPSFTLVGWFIISGELPQMESSPIAGQLFKAAKATSTDGFQILSELEAITPVPEMRAAHESVARCMDFATGDSSNLALALEFGIPWRLTDAGRSCDLLDPSLAQLQAFVDEYE